MKKGDIIVPNGTSKQSRYLSITNKSLELEILDIMPWTSTNIKVRIIKGRMRSKKCTRASHRYKGDTAYVNPAHFKIKNNSINSFFI